MSNLSQVPRGTVSEPEMGRQWKRNQRITDAEFVAAWRLYVWKRARAWCRRHNLPEYCVDDYVSAGYAALAAIPRANRWSARYVMTAIRNRMFSAGRRRRGEPHPESMVSADCLLAAGAAGHEDEAIERVDLERAMSALSEAQRKVVLLQLAGCTMAEVAERMGIESLEARELAGSAHTLLRAALAPPEAASLVG